MNVSSVTIEGDHGTFVITRDRQARKHDTLALYKRDAKSGGEILQTEVAVSRSMNIRAVANQFHLYIEGWSGTMNEQTWMALASQIELLVSDY